jgi:hypothetical protein
MRPIFLYSPDSPSNHYEHRISLAALSLHLSSGGKKKKKKKGKKSGTVQGAAVGRSIKLKR